MPPALEDDKRPPLLSHIWAGRAGGPFTVQVSIWGWGGRDGASPATCTRASSTLLPRRLLCFNTFQRGKNGGGAEKRRKNLTAKTSYKKSPPTELSASEPSQGRAACWSLAGNSLKKSLDLMGGVTYVQRDEGVTRGLPPGPRGPRTGWLAAASGPACSERAGTAAGSVR